MAFVNLLVPARIHAVATVAAEIARPWIRPAGFVLVWTALCVALGLIIGASAVILPPTGAFGIVGGVFIVLLWVSPDDARLAPSITLARRLMTIAIIVNLCVPDYYAFDVPGLPWISFRRLALFPLVAVILLLVATSVDARKRLLEVGRASRLLTTCVLGFAIASFLSIFVSHSPPTSVSRFINLLLEWYLPAMTVVVAFRDERDISRLLRLVSYCAFFVACAGIAEFILQRSLFVTLMPQWMFDAIASENPTVAALAQAGGFRNGFYRAFSTYSIPLSFGEFAGMMFPLGMHYLAYGRSGWDRTYGALLGITLLLAIFASGSRGAYQMVFVAAPLYLIFWMARTARTSPRSLAPAIMSSIALPVVLSITVAVLFWQRAHNIVFGGGMEQYSTQARWDEWAMALPHVLKSPIIGNGFAVSADVVGFTFPGAIVATLDSSLISVLVESGIVGFVSFFGMIIIASVIAGIDFLSDRSESSTYCAAISCSLAGFFTYRIVLSQNDNHITLFILIAILLSIRTFSRNADEKKTAPLGSKLVDVAPSRL